MSIINMEWYRIFLYAAKEGNLTKAAQKLNLTQPTVSYTIKQLESIMDVKLFNRLSKGVKLTAEGSALLEYVEKSFSLLDAGENKIQSLKNLRSGLLRIGASGPIIKHLLLNTLDQFHNMYPEVRIRLIQANTQQITNHLKNEKIDIGFINMPLFDKEIDVRQVEANEDCFVVGTKLKKLTQRPISTEELTEIPLLLLSPGSSTRIFVDKWFNDQGFEIEVDFELNSTEMLIELARRGYGAAFVNRSFVEKELKDGVLFELPLVEPIPSRSIGLATKQDISLPLVASRFMELLNSSKS